MNVMILVSGKKVNGVLTYCNQLCSQLVRRGFHVWIVTRRDGWLLDHRVDGVSYLECEFRRGWSDLRSVARYVRELDIDLVHTHMSRANFFGVLLKLFARVPVVATAHNCRFQPHWALNDYVIANSGFTLRQQRKLNRVSKTRSDCVYCFVDADRFRIVPEQTKTRIRNEVEGSTMKTVLGIVGDVGPRKGQNVLVEALPGLIEEFPDLVLWIIGNHEPDSAYSKTLGNTIDRLGLSDRVRILGVKRDVENYMVALDVCVIPSVREPLGLVAIESMLVGTPVVATSVGGLPEIVVHGETGILVPERNSESLADAIGRVLRDRALRNTLARNAKRFVTDKFDEHRLTDGVIEIYRQVVSRKIPRTSW